MLPLLEDPGPGLNSAKGEGFPVTFCRQLDSPFHAPRAATTTDRKVAVTGHKFDKAVLEVLTVIHNQPVKGPVTFLTFSVKREYMPSCRRPALGTLPPVVNSFPIMRLVGVNPGLPALLDHRFPADALSGGKRPKRHDGTNDIDDGPYFLYVSIDVTKEPRLGLRMKLLSFIGPLISQVISLGTEFLSDRHIVMNVNMCLDLSDLLKVSIRVLTDNMSHKASVHMSFRIPQVSGLAKVIDNSLAVIVKRRLINGNNSRIDSSHVLSSL